MTPGEAALRHGGETAAARFPDRLRLPLRFETDLLRRDLDTASAHGWTKHFVKQNYEGDWSIIPLRCVAGETHPVRMIYPNPTARSFADTPLLERCPGFRRVLASFDCHLRAVRLMRLTPGSVINEHTDLDLSFEDGMVRVHIPITTNEHVAFHLNGSRVVLEAGSAWYLRLSDPHRVANHGTADRVHLVVDADVNAWVEALFEAAMQQSWARDAGISRQESAAVE